MFFDRQDAKSPWLLTLACVFFLQGAVLLSPALAQRTKRQFKEGDEIEYLWVSTWYPGVVLAVEGNMVAIEYQWGGQPKREQVQAFKLRYAWEARAISPMRFWSDESKKFKVRAAALAVEDDHVLLHKEDGTEVNVPIAKLSTADQRLLAKYKRQAPPPIPQLPADTAFTRISLGSGIAWSSADNLAVVSPDGPPSFAKVPMKGVAFPKIHRHENLVRLDPIGGSDGWMVAGTSDFWGKLPGRVLWCSLTSGKVRRMQMLPVGERVVAVDPPSRQLLTVNKEGPRLTIWDADPTLEMAKPKKRWLSVADDNWGSWDNWGEIVGRDRVLHEWGKHQFVCWDIAGEQEVYRIEQESFFSARPVLSPGKRYIALPEDKRVRIMEAATGQTLAVLDIEGGSAAGVGFSPSGEKLAILTRSQLAVWTFASDQPPQRYRADSIGTPFSARLEWVDDHSLLVDRKTLFDLRLELPVWSYSAKTFEVQKDRWGERTMTVVGGKLCYAVTISSPQDGFIVGAVDLPGPLVREKVDGLDPDSLYIVRRGHPVSIQVDCGQYNDQVQDALMNQIEDNGWVYDASSDTVLTAKMSRGETQTVTYRMTNGRGGERNESVTVTPYISTLQVLYQGSVAWHAGGGSGAPPVIFLRGNESAQDKATSMQRPDPGLFSRAKIPEKIFDPAKKHGLGSSTISSRGLIPNL